MTVEDIFSKDQCSVILGSLLGDGHITNPKSGNSAFTKNQCKAHFSYLQWHRHLFGEKCGDLSESVITLGNKKHLRYNLRLRSHAVFTQLRRKWYPDNIKIIPFDIKLDPLTIAIWFFDDGGNYLRKRSLKFATYCFSKNEVEFLGNQLHSSYGIKYRISNRNEICIIPESSKNLIDLVSPYMIWDCFQHKIVYRESKLQYITDEQAEKIIDLYHKKWTMKEIAKEINCSISSVSAMVRGDRKKHLGQSVRSVACNNTSGHTGVYFEKNRNKWIANVKVNGKNKKLGRYATLEEAIYARNSFNNEN